MMDDVISPPREFLVGAVFGNVAGGGHLLVAPGHDELNAGSLTGHLAKVNFVRHRGSRAITYTARLLPPWMNCSIVVSDGERAVLATYPLWMRRKVLSALQESGFEVVRKLTLIERGYEAMRF